MKITDDWAETVGDTAEIRELIYDLIRHYGELLGLDNWDIIPNIYSNEGDDDRASCEASPEYKRAQIQLNLASIPPSQLDRVIRHELIHALTWPLFHIAHELASTDAELEWVRLEHERLTENLTTMPLWDEIAGVEVEESEPPAVFPNIINPRPTNDESIETEHIPTVGGGNSRTIVPEAGEFS